MICDFSCALFSSPAGKIICWGRGEFGQLGTGNTLSKGLSASDMTSLPFISFSSSDPAVSVSAGYVHTCALFGGRVRCWGYGSYGQLGTDRPNNIGDDPTEMSVLQFIAFSDSVPVVEVSSGRSHTCSVLANGRTRCWGSGSFGALGLDSTVTFGNGINNLMANLPDTLTPLYATPMAGSISGGTDITLTGAVIGEGARASFSSLSCSSSPSAPVFFPAVDVSYMTTPAWPCSPGPVNISVSTNSASFYFYDPAAAIDTISSAAWTVGDSLLITITGSDLIFTPVAECRFGSHARSTLVVTGPTSGVCQNPSSASAGESLPFSFSLDGYSNINTSLTVTIMCQTEQYKQPDGLCVACPDNSYSGGLLNITSCRCKPGFYSKKRSTGVPCLKCPTGATCNGGTNTPIPIYGYWSSSNDFSSSNDSYTVFHCEPERACPGGAPDECAGGFEGRVCARCVPGYFRTANDCIQCPRGSHGIIVGVILLVIVVAILFLALGGQKRTKAYGGTLAIGAKFFQVLMVVGRLNVSWPKRVRDVVEKVTAPLTLKLDVVGLECSDVKITYEVKWALTMLLPVFFALAFALVYALVRVWLRLRRRIFSARLKDQAINAYLSVFSLGFLTIASTALEPFACVEREDSTWAMVVNPSRNCYDSAWWRLAGWAVAAVLLYVVAIPIGLFVFLHKNRSRLGDDLKFGDRFSGLYANYVPSLAHVWEPVVMLEKVVIACVGIFLAGFAMLQALVLLLLLVGTLSVYQAYAPYARGKDNRLHTVLRWCSIVVLGAGMLFCADKFPSVRARYFFEWLSVLVIAGSTVLVFSSLAYNVWVIRKSLKVGLSKDLEACLSVFNRFGREEVARWLRHSSAGCRDRVQAVLEAIRGQGAVDVSEGGKDAPLLDWVELAPVVIVEDAYADQVVSTFTRNVLRTDVVPVVRTWLITTPDKELVDHFIESFTAFGRSKQDKEQRSRRDRRREELQLPTASSAPTATARALIERLYGPALAQAAIESKGLSRERWREAFHTLFLA
jgi:hypothetical protein